MPDFKKPKSRAKNYEQYLAEHFGPDFDQALRDSPLTNTQKKKLKSNFGKVVPPHLDKIGWQERNWL